MVTNTERATDWALPPLDESAEVLTHPGPVHPARISAFRGKTEPVLFTTSEEASLDEIIRNLFEERGWSSANGELVSGRLHSFSYSYPIPGPDDTSRVALSPPAQVAEATIVHGGITVGSRDGAPLVHTHAVFTDLSGARLGGHLHYESVRFEAGAQIRFWGTRDVVIDAEHDPEIGVPIFQFSGSCGIDGSGGDGRNAVLARIRPNVDLTCAIEAVLSRAELTGRILVPGQIGSLIGTTFDDSGEFRRIAGPVVEVLKLTPSIRSNGDEWSVELEAEIVDSQGRLHSGTLARGLNPVAMTFELGLFSQAD